MQNRPNNTNNIRSVVIAGGGTAGWMTAAAFANRIMQTVGCSVTLVESDAIGTIGVGEATVPSLRLFHRLTYGLDEADLMRHVQGTFKLGIRFDDWTRPGHSYFHPFGIHGASIQRNFLHFQHYWMHGRRLGDAREIVEYNMSAMAARAGKFTAPAADRSSILSELEYAYHLDAGLYAAYLRRYAEARGVWRVEGRIVNVALRSEDGFIEALELDGGRRLAADLFIDCTGFRGVLIEQALAAGYEDWSRYLPCDRAVAVAAENRGPLAPYTVAIARPHGWQWRIPLQHRSGNGYVYSSRHCSDDEAASLLLANLEGPPLRDPIRLRFATGRRRRYWKRNCVAIGLSAGFVEPLESTSIFLIYDSILRLMSLFPNADFAPENRDLFNRLTDAVYEDIRDFLLLHYHATERTEPLWTASRNLGLPESLRQRIEMFRTAAHAHVEDSFATRGAAALFEETRWVSVMLGQNIMPQAYHPFVAGMGDRIPLLESLADLRGLIRKAVDGMPAHDEYIARYCPAEPA